MKKILNLLFCVFFIIIVNSSYVFAMNVNTGGDNGSNNGSVGDEDNQWYSWCGSKDMDYYTNINDCRLDWTELNAPPKMVYRSTYNQTYDMNDFQMNKTVNNYTDEDYIKDDEKEKS